MSLKSTEAGWSNKRPALGRPGRIYTIMPLAIVKSLNEGVPYRLIFSR